MQKRKSHKQILAAMVALEKNLFKAIEKTKVILKAKRSKKAERKVA